MTWKTIKYLAGIILRIKINIYTSLMVYIWVLSLLLALLQTTPIDAYFKSLWWN